MDWIKVILGVLLIVIMAYVVVQIKDKGILFFIDKNPYCEKSGVALNEFSERLSSRINNNQNAQANLLYAMSADCFRPEDIKLDQSKKDLFFCSGKRPSSPKTFDVSSTAQEWVKSYCAES